MSNINTQINKLVKVHDNNNYFNETMKAAQDGDTDAQNKLASLYHNGKGTERNVEEAFYWYQKAVENGNTDAQNNLASLYYYGEGTEKNLEKAFYWTQKAAESGNTEAQNNLAVFYHNG